MTVSGVEDDDAGDEAVEVNVAASGGDYAGATATVVVTVTDDETRRVWWWSRTRLTVSEGGTESFAVKLATEPLADVDVTVSSGDPGAAASSGSFKFTRSQLEHRAAGDCARRE